MNINKHNYEAFFLDYHEGNLAPQEVAELLLFLEQHPELKEEFESFENFSLTDDEMSIQFKDKSELKKEVTAENIDEFLVKKVEGELLPIENDILEQYIKQHPQSQKDLELYKRAKVSPDHSIVFDKKSDLKMIPSLLPYQQESASDTLLISSLEGLLSADELKMLEKQLKADATLNREYALFSKAKLVADPAIVYPDKAELKRYERKAIPFYYYVATAASVALLVGLFTFLNKPASIENYASTIDTILLKEANPAAENAKLHPATEQAMTATVVPASEKKSVAKVKKNRSTHKAVNKMLASVQTNASGNDLNKENPEQLTVNEVISNENTLALANNSSNTSTTEQKKYVPSVKQALGNTEYLSLKEMAVSKIKQKALDEDEALQQKKTGRYKKLSGWDLAQLVAKGVSKLTGKDINVDPSYNEQGEVTAYALNAGKLAFSVGK
ncbi:MAG: hypothetical protein J0L87_06465 [Bacteroidetes bacterium]|nr:hypothetical protein [Bacteroidota bacterium]